MIILESKRLILKTLENSNIQELHKKIFSDVDVMRYAFAGKTFTLEESEIFIDKYFAKASSKVGIGVLFDKEDNTLIGLAGLIKFNENDCEIGFMLAKEFWGNGYAKEIGKAQIDLANNELNFEHIYATANPENKNSLKALMNLNMSYLKDIYLDDRGIRKLLIYKF
ncbi:GNAT family acetyltransferase Bsu1853 (YoaA) [hydrothermal vent metagenome]|uniref:GNAT family acetyltransferase Bsu1853 (YoaA) n=1 Tax=hydrothermal vent metagenome TaxID=652676 RepID=A0A1W1EEX2_9ZZZZ